MTCTILFLILDFKCRRFFAFDSKFFPVLVDVLDDLLSLILQVFAMIAIPELAHTVAKVDFDSTLVHQNVIHP